MHTSHWIFAVLEEFVDLHDVFTKIFIVDWPAWRQSWYYPQTGDVTLCVNGLIGQNDITAEHNKVWKLFLLWLLYIYTLSHKHVSTVTVDEFIAFIAAFVCWNRCNLLGKIHVAGGRDSLIFYLTKNYIQYKTSFQQARYSFHVWFINIEIDKTLHMSRKSVVNKTSLSPLYSKCLAINIHV